MIIQGAPPGEDMGHLLSCMAQTHILSRVRTGDYTVEAVVGLFLTGAISLLSVRYIRVESPAKGSRPGGSFIFWLTS